MPKSGLSITKPDFDPLEKRFTLAGNASAFWTRWSAKFRPGELHGGEAVRLPAVLVPRRVAEQMVPSQKQGPDVQEVTSVLSPQFKTHKSRR
jgi:hypothetical protein